MPAPTARRDRLDQWKVRIRDPIVGFAVEQAWTPPGIGRNDEEAGIPGHAVREHDMPGTGDYAPAVRRSRQPSTRP